MRNGLAKKQMESPEHALMFSLSNQLTHWDIGVVSVSQAWYLIWCTNHNWWRGGGVKKLFLCVNFDNSGIIFVIFNSVKANINKKNEEKSWAKLWGLWVVIIRAWSDPSYLPAWWVLMGLFSINYFGWKMGNPDSMVSSCQLWPPSSSGHDVLV